MGFVRYSLSSMAFFAFFAVIFFSFDVRAADGDLTKEGVGAFLASQKAMYPIDEELKAAGERSIFRPKQNDLARTGQPAYQTNVKQIKKGQPEFYSRFEEVVIGIKGDDDDQVFASLEDWAKMGDRIMTAFYSANTSKAKSAKLKLQRDLPPEAMALIQSIPEAKKALDDAMGAMDTMANVSKNDKEVVQAYSKEIIVHINTVKGEDGYAISE